MHINQLPRLNRKTREHFCAEGIITIAQVAAMTPDELRRFRGIKTSAEAIHASALAMMQRQPVWYRPLPAQVQQGGWMFDIETIMPDNEFVWSIGWNSTDSPIVNIVLVDPDAQHVLTQFRLPNQQDVFIVPDADSAWRFFAEAVADGRSVYHWSPFDRSVMNLYAPDEVRDSLHGRLVDMCHLFDHVVKCPIPNVSLKTVAPYIAPNFGWADHTDVFIAHINYHQWLRGRQPEALQRACRYQADDVDALLLVWDWLQRHHKAD